MPQQRLTELSAIEAAAWRELGRAVSDKEHAWRVAVLATARMGEPRAVDGAEGAGPEGHAGAADSADAQGADARCIVLREIDHAARTIMFFADARSEKVRQIEARPSGVLVLWSPQLAWQLRLSVALEVATSGLAVSSRWARLKMTPAAQDYLSPLPPGTALTDLHPLPERGTREFFAVITAQVQRLDWLELRAEGQRRAIFDAEGARWVVP